MLVDALKIPIQELPRWLWNYECPDYTEAREKELMLAIKYTLSDFAGKCNRKYSRRSNSERTFWIDRLVPIFQSFADQTNLLTFEWCEVHSKAHAESNTDTDGSTCGSARYADGIGIDRHENKRLVTEASSGEFKENMLHTLDDTLKQIHSSIMMLKSDIRSHLGASFVTMCKVGVYGIQSVRNSITLPKTQLDGAQGGYIYQELRTVEITTDYTKRHKRLKVMDLMAVLLNMLEAQDERLKQLGSEQVGEIEARDDLRVRPMLKPLSCESKVTLAAATAISSATCSNTRQLYLLMNFAPQNFALPVTNLCATPKRKGIKLTLVPFFVTILIVLPSLEDSLAKWHSRLMPIPRLI